MSLPTVAPLFARRLTRRLAAWFGVVVVLLATFALYGQSDLMFTLSQMMWACFGTQAS